MVFAKSCASCPNKGKGYDYFESNHFMTRHQNQTMATDDGFEVRGTFASDDTCYAMAGSRK